MLSLFRPLIDRVKSSVVSVKVSQAYGNLLLAELILLGLLGWWLWRERGTRAVA